MKDITFTITSSNYYEDYCKIIDFLLKPDKHNIRINSTFFTTSFFTYNPSIMFNHEKEPGYLHRFWNFGIKPSKYSEIRAFHREVGFKEVGLDDAIIEKMKTFSSLDEILCLKDHILKHILKEIFEHAKKDLNKRVIFLNSKFECFCIAYFYTVLNEHVVIPYELLRDIYDEMFDMDNIKTTTLLSLL